MRRAFEDVATATCLLTSRLYSRTMNESRLVLLANFSVTLFMTGVIWYVQIAHYPLFLDVGPQTFTGYHASHNNVTTLVVALPMVIEFGLSVLLIVARPAEVALPVALVLIALGALPVL